MKFLKKVLKAIINDIKTDIQFIEKVYDGKYKIPKYIKNADWKKVFKQIFTDKWTYIFLMLFILTWLSGYLYSTEHYQQACNEYIWQYFGGTFNNYGGYIDQTILNTTIIP